jgi:hypothetical protein
MNSNYREIWRRANGPIPRGYEIHHIDGDRSNNDLSNLLCLSLQEHYDLHFSQEDWAACHLLGKRLKISNEELFEVQSKAAKANCKKQLDNGTWHLAKDGEFEEKRLANLRGSKKHKQHLEGLNQRVMAAGNHTSQRMGTCVHCGRTMDISNLGKYHNDRCKNK